jgi:ABC-2 type transport system permease protein
MAGVADPPILAPEGAPAPGEVRRVPVLNPSHVATLFWLRWKLTQRGFARGGRARIVGLVFMLVFLLPLVGGLAVATTVGFRNLPRASATQLLFAVLTLLYVFWAIFPLLQYTLNEGLDVTKLQIYPVTRAEQMVGLVLATLLDVGTLALIGLYVPVVIGWSNTPAAMAVTLVALALAYVHTVGLSQLVMAAFMGLLRSRRYRDISIVIFALVGASCSVAGQFVTRLLRVAAGSGGIELPQIDGYAQFTPPGMAARAIELAARGAYLPALAWLAALAALVPVLLVVWAQVLERGITAAETAGGAPSRRVRRGRAGREPAAGVAPAVPGVPVATAARRWRPLSRAALAFAGKDARYLWRDPQLKASILSALFLLVFVLVPTFSPTRGLHAMQVLYVPIPTLVVTLNLSLNALGLERQGLQMLFLFPVRPLDVFWGKNLTVGLVTFGAQVALTLGLAAITGGWFYVPLALAAGLAAILVLMGCGNVTSVLLPFRVRELRIGRSDLSSENGCLRSVLSMVTLLISALLLSPVIVALVIPLALDQHLWLAGSLPFAIAYGAALHQVATRLIAPRLLTRAPEILAATVRE